MNRFVIIPNTKKDKDLSVTGRVAETLVAMGGVVYLDAAIPSDLPVLRYTDFPEDAELVIVIGGDGSVLDASVAAIRAGIPLLGVNLGRRGYLSEVEPNGLDVLRRLLTGDYFVKENMLLSLSVTSGGETLVSERLAVNDIYLSHDNAVGICEFSITDKEGEAVNLRADGAIFGTPAGSTAYSLSAGGPIVSHRLDSILVTPVCPHSFFDRSILFSPDEILVAENVGEGDLTVSVDGRPFRTLRPGDTCRISVSEKRLKMLTFTENAMFTTLFRKMKLSENL